MKYVLCKFCIFISFIQNEAVFRYLSIIMLMSIRAPLSEIFDDYNTPQLMTSNHPEERRRGAEHPHEEELNVFEQ